MCAFDRIDLHMHTSVSDGTDAPEEIVERVRAAGLDIFSVTDHDSFSACVEIGGELKSGDPAFVFGVEFSCEDEDGLCHILGYGYDANAPSIIEAVATGHDLRISKLSGRLKFMEDEFGFTFSEDDRSALYRMNNPGKPHLGNLLVKYGYAATKSEAIKDFVNKCGDKEAHLSPEYAVEAIIKAGGIPVIAHPSLGGGNALITGERMEKRIKKLVGYGLKGLEAFYSGFDKELMEETLSFARKYDLYVTAGSDYHGANKTVELGQTNAPKAADYPEGLKRFLKDVKKAF